MLKYLQHMKDWGILYWQSALVDSLPAIAIEQPALDPSLPFFPQHSLLQLVGFVNAAYATDTNTQCSLTGIVFCLAGGAIAYKSRLQATVTTSSIKAKLIAAVHAAKIAKYLWAVLHEFGIPQEDPTPLSDDNISAIVIINKHKPTLNSRHIDIQHFAI